MDRTIKKSSPDEFVPFVAAGPDEPFRLAPSFWDAMTSDPHVRTQLQRELEARVDAALEAHSSGIFEQAKERGYRAGFDAGREAGFAEGAVAGKDRVARMEDRLAEVCRDIVDNRALLLAAHERAWGAALRHLLKRFLVPRSQAIGELVSAWLAEALARFAPSARVSIRVSPTEHADWVRYLPDVAGKGWEVLADPSLAPGDVSCECEDGGMIFSSTEELDKLDAWLAHFESQPEPVEALVLSSGLEAIA